MLFALRGAIANLEESIRGNERTRDREVQKSDYMRISIRSVVDWRVNERMSRPTKETVVGTS